MGVLRSIPQEKTDTNLFGRWSYVSYLGEGGLARVYRVADAKQGGRQVALKVLRAHARAVHAFELHREAQWSLELLHNEKAEGYSERLSGRFAKYFEDHSGLAQVKNYPRLGANCKLLEELRHCQSETFAWTRCREGWSERPHVVLEALPGQSLHHFLSSSASNAPGAMESWLGKKAHGAGRLKTKDAYHILVQVAEGCLYLNNFHLIHRDVRPCNIQLLPGVLPNSGGGGGDSSGTNKNNNSGSRNNNSNSNNNSNNDLRCIDTEIGPVVKILDLGVMILAEEANRINMNESIHVFEPERVASGGYDWLPWEVRPGLVNFAWPTHSFDSFSLGVLWLQLSEGLRDASSTLAALSRGVPPPCPIDCTLEQMLSAAEVRPKPQEYLKRLRQFRAAAPTGSSELDRDPVKDKPTRTRKFPKAAQEVAESMPKSSVCRGLTSRAAALRTVASACDEMLGDGGKGQQQQKQQQQQQEQPKLWPQSRQQQQQKVQSQQKQQKKQQAPQNFTLHSSARPTQKSFDFDAFAEKCEAMAEVRGRSPEVALSMDFLREGLDRMVANLDLLLRQHEDTDVQELLSAVKLCKLNAEEAIIGDRCI